MPIINIPDLIHTNQQNNILTYYTCLPQHRSRQYGNRSFWIVSLQEEVDCFEYSFLNNWHNGSIGWGLKQNGNNLEVVGLSADNDELKLAKFVNDVTQDTHYWHGYPADYRRKPQDRPIAAILLIWRNGNIITKSHMSKIKRGQICYL